MTELTVEWFTNHYRKNYEFIQKIKKANRRTMIAWMDEQGRGYSGPHRPEHLALWMKYQIALGRRVLYLVHIYTS